MKTYRLVVDWKDGNVTSDPMEAEHAPVEETIELLKKVKKGEIPYLRLLVEGNETLIPCQIIRKSVITFKEC